MIQTDTIDVDTEATLRDADVLPDGRWIAVASRFSTDYLLLPGMQIELKRQYRYPIVRFLNDYEVLVVDSTSRDVHDKNATVISISGPNREQCFPIGDHVADVVVTPRYIACTYHDRGVLEGNPISAAGIAIFNHNGDFRHGYGAKIGMACDVMDCYSACNTIDDEIAFVSYPGFPFVIWNLKSNEHSVNDLPSSLVGSQSMSCRRGCFYFHRPYGSKAGFYRLINGEAAFVCEIRKRLKPLRDGRLLAVGKHSLTIIEPTVEVQ